MDCLVKYVGFNTIAGLGMNEDCGILGGDAKYQYRVWLGYNMINENRYIIISKTSHRANRTKWFVNSMKVPWDKMEQGISDEELEKIYKETIITKNQVLARNLESKLEELSRTAT